MEAAASGVMPSAPPTASTDPSRSTIAAAPVVATGRSVVFCHVLVVAS
jgi:hypothetical protein